MESRKIEENANQMVELKYVEQEQIQGGGIIDTIKSWLGIDSGVKFGGGSSGGGGASGSW